MLLMLTFKTRTCLKPVPKYNIKTIEQAMGQYCMCLYLKLAVVPKYNIKTTEQAIGQCCMCVHWRPMTDGEASTENTQHNRTLTILTQNRKR